MSHRAHKKVRKLLKKNAVDGQADFVSTVLRSPWWTRVWFAWKIVWKRF